MALGQNLFSFCEVNIDVFFYLHLYVLSNYKTHIPLLQKDMLPAQLLTSVQTQQRSLSYYYHLHFNSQMSAGGSLVFSFRSEVILQHKL